MFGLLKLLAYGLLGYAIYEFFRGMSGNAEAATGGGGRMQLGGSSSRNIREEAGRANLTGPGRGMDVTTQDDSGESVRRTVGRGVIS